MAIVAEDVWDALEAPLQEGLESQPFRDAVGQIAAKAKAKLPESNGRIEAAVRLILAGHVTVNEDGSVTVGGSAPEVRYVVVDGTCPCRDFPKAPGSLCKHRLASAILRRAHALVRGDHTPPEPPQVVGTLPTSTPATIPLPEAPASANCHITIAGRQVQVTLRDTDEGRLLLRLQKLLEQYPVGHPSTDTPIPPSASTGQPEGWCAFHQVQMPLHEKAGRTWYSHQTDAGTWCKGKGRGRA